jgi:hypothetical protein
MLGPANPPAKDSLATSKGKHVSYTYGKDLQTHKALVCNYYKGSDVRKASVELRDFETGRKDWVPLADIQDAVRIRNPHAVVTHASEYVQVCFFGGASNGDSFHYKTNTEPDKIIRSKRVPEGMDEEWTHWARSHPGVWGPPDIALNGIEVMADGKYAIYWADLGDVAEVVQPNRRGRKREVVDSFEDLLDAVPGLDDPQRLHVKQATVGKYLTDTVGSLDLTDQTRMAGSATCTRVGVVPYGQTLVDRLTSDTEGCAIMSVLMCMPEQMRERVGIDGACAIRDSACRVHAERNPNAISLLLCPLSQMDEALNNKRVKRESMNQRGIGRVCITKVNVPNDCGDCAVAMANGETPPKHRNPTIYELLAKPAGTSFVITVATGTSRTHCIALLNNTDGTRVFADPARGEFYEATAESFRQLGFDGVSDTRQVAWCCVSNGKKRSACTGVCSGRLGKAARHA